MRNRSPTASQMDYNKNTQWGASVILLFFSLVFAPITSGQDDEFVRLKQKCITTVENYKRAGENDRDYLRKACYQTCRGRNLWETGQLSPYTQLCAEKEKPYKCGNRPLCRISAMNIVKNCRTTPCSNQDSLSRACVSACSPQTDSKCHENDLRDFQQGQMLCQSRGVDANLDFIGDDTAKELEHKRNEELLFRTHGETPRGDGFYQSMFYKGLPSEDISPTPILGGVDVPNVTEDDYYAAAGGNAEGSSGAPGRRDKNKKWSNKQVHPDVLEHVKFEDLEYRFEKSTTAKPTAKTRELDPLVRLQRMPASHKKKRVDYFSKDHHYTNDKVHLWQKDVFQEVKKFYDKIELDHYGEISP